MSELEILEEELVDTLEDIQDDWETKAANIKATEVPLEKTDLTVDELVLVWIATA
jgi:hypothetical protein